MSAQCGKQFTGVVIDDNCITTPSPLLAGQVGVAYSETLTAPILTEPLTWEVVNGTIPDGLEIGVNTGEIFGVPTVDGSFSFQINVTSPDGNHCVKNFTLNVTAVATPFWDDVTWTIATTGLVTEGPPEIQGAVGITNLNYFLFFDGCTMTTTGTKAAYTGPEISVHIQIVVGGWTPGNPINFTLGALFNETFDAPGVFDFDVTVPAGSGVEYLFIAQTAFTSGAGECYVTLSQP